MFLEESLSSLFKTRSVNDTKILITTDVFTPTINGVVTSVLNLSQQLMDNGHVVKILTLSKDHQSKKLDNVYYIKSFHLPIYPEVRGTFSFWDSYLDEIIEWNPDIIHSQSEFFTLVFAKKIAQRAKIPIIHTYHTMYESYTHYFIKSKRMGKKIVAYLTKKILRNVDTIIAPTKKVFNSLKLYHVENNIEIVPTGIKLHKFSQQLSQKEKNELRSYLGIALDAKVLVTVGRLAKEKNADELIDNMVHLVKEDTKITLLFVGDGPYYNYLKQRVKKLLLDKHVVFAGMIKQQEIYKYYQISDILVSASTSETQGLTYIEAFASGLPVICRKDSSVEGLIEDGHNGFSYMNSIEYVNQVKSLFEDDMLANTISNNGKRIVNHYCVSNFGSKMEQIYLNRITKQIDDQIDESVKSSLANQ